MATFFIEHTLGIQAFQLLKSFTFPKDFHSLQTGILLFFTHTKTEAPVYFKSWENFLRKLLGKSQNLCLQKCQTLMYAISSIHKSHTQTSSCTHKINVTPSIQTIFPLKDFFFLFYLKNLFLLYLFFQFSLH